MNPLSLPNYPSQTIAYGIGWADDTARTDGLLSLALRKKGGRAKSRQGDAQGLKDR